MKIKISENVLNNIKNQDYYSETDFIKDCKCYIKAVKSGRIQYKVTHVSQSGMTRNISITSFEGNIKRGYYRSYYSMLKALGYRFTKYDDVIVNGCGMNMVWNTNYNIINTLCDFGFINKPNCDRLAQNVN